MKSIGFFLRQFGYGIFYLSFSSLIGSFLLGCAHQRVFPEPVESDRKGLFDRFGKRTSPPKKNFLAHIEDQYDARSQDSLAQMKKSDSVKVTRRTRRPRRSSESVSRAEGKTERHERNVVSLESSESSLPYQWPLKSVQVTSHFGKRGRHFHEGIDLRAASGTPIYAVKGGIVLYAQNRIRGYGKMIVIRHDEKMATIYAHASKVLVKRGQRVKKGQQIALSGSTGRVSGPHLHFEVRNGLGAVDPVEVLPQITDQSRTKTRKVSQISKFASLQ